MFFNKQKQNKNEVVAVDMPSIPIPQYPIEAFPKIIQELAKELKEKEHYSIDYFLTGLLTVIAANIGLRMQLKIKSKWSEAPSLYSCLLGNSSALKSPVIKFLMAPVRDLQKEYTKQHKILHDKFEKETYQKKKFDNDDDIVVPQKPTKQSAFMSDTNTEVMILRMADNPKGIFLVKDELVSLITSMNKSGKGDDESKILSWYSGSTEQKDRVGDATLPYIEKFQLNILGGTQPTELKTLSNGKRGSNGFVFRFLWAYPDEEEMKYYNEQEIDPKLEHVYKNIYDKILETNNIDFDYEFGEQKSREIPFSTESKKIWKKFNDTNVDMINKHHTDSTKSLFKKIEAIMPRTALILQVLYWACGETNNLTAVEEAAATGATKLAEYYRATAIKVQQEINDLVDEQESAGRTQNINWNNIFTKKGQVLSRQDIGTELTKLYGMTERTVSRICAKELTLVRRGYYKQ